MRSGGDSQSSLAAFIASAVCLAACTNPDEAAVRPVHAGPSSALGGDGRVDAGADAAAYPAPHASLPHIEFSGGTVVRHPRVVPIFYPGDADQGDIERFLATLPGSSYWARTTEEYGVGDISVTESVVLDETPPTSTTGLAIRTWFASHVTGARAGWPAFTAQDIYVVFFPITTTIDAFGYKGCSAFDGYHDEASRRRVPVAATGDGGVVSEAGAAAAPAGPFPFAVVVRCKDEFGTRRPIDNDTITLSHELIEAATDPLTQTRPAYGTVDSDHSAWSLGYSSEPLGEVGDMCLYEGRPVTTVGGFVAQRTWSNRAVAAGLDPCVPEGPTPLFGAAPDAADPVQIGNSSALGVQIPIGGSKTIDVRLFSYARVPDFLVSAFEGPRGNGGAMTPTLEFQWDRQIGNNGDVFKLTITRSFDASAQDSTVVIIYSNQDTTGTTYFGGNSWPLVVTD